MAGKNVVAAEGYTTYVYDLDFSKGNGTTLIVNPYVEGDETKAEVPAEAITFTYVNKDITTPITYLDGSTVSSGGKGVKLQSGSALAFSTKADWSAELILGCKTADQTVAVVVNSVENPAGVVVDGSVTDVNSANNKITITGGTSGTINIKRSMAKECWIADMILKVTVSNSAEHCNVYFYDGDVLQEELTTDVIVGNAVSAPDTVLPFPDGKIFAGWTADPETNEEYDFTQAVDGDLNLYAIWEDYTVDNPNLLDSNLLARWGKAYYQVTKNENIKIIGTNFTITDDMNFLVNSDNVTVLKNGGGMVPEEDSNALIFEAQTSGKLIVEVKSGSSNAGQVLECQTVDGVVATSVDASFDNTSYKAIEFTITKPGTYYIGNVEGTVEYRTASFTAEDKLVGAQVSTDGTAVRFVGLLNGTDFNKVVFSVTCNDVNVTKEMPTVYENVTAAENGVQTIVSASDLGCDYLAAWTITGLDANTEYVFTVSVSVDGIAGDTFTVTVNKGVVTVVRVAE